MLILLSLFFYHFSANAGELPHLSARQVMNIFYQNCKASKLRPYDFTKDGEALGFSYEYNPITKGKVSKVADVKKAQDFFYLNCSQPKSEQGKFLCENPPSYLWGGKSFIDEQKKTVDLFHNTDEVEPLAHHPGLDCSGFVNLTFLHAGLKVDRDFPYLKAPMEISAREFMAPLSCFKEVHIEKKQPLKDGDVIAWDKHIVMVDHVSNDPFGLKKIRTPEECDLRKLNPLKAGMIIINSKGANDPKEQLETDFVKNSLHLKNLLSNASEHLSGVGPGITRLYLSQLSIAAPLEMADLIQTACLAKFNIHIPSRKIKVVRHVLADKNPTADEVAHCRLSQNEQVQFLGDLSCK